MSKGIRGFIISNNECRISNDEVNIQYFLRYSSFNIRRSIFQNSRLISRSLYQSNPGKEKQQRNDPHHGKGGKMCGMIDDIGAGVDQSNDPQHGKYGPEDAFQVHDFE
jgi:hypothetical protein